LLQKLLHLEFSPEAVGWGASVVVHLSGGLAAWMFAASLTAAPTLPGQTSRVQLQATWQEPVEQQYEPEPLAIDSRVWITPHEARIAEHTYVQRSTDVSQPSPAELALAERLLAAPPPSVRPRDASPQPSDRDVDAPPARPAPRRAQSTPAVVVVEPTAGADPQTPAKLLRNRPPTYPAEAVIHGWEGTVLLRLHIAADGWVSDVELLSSSGHRILDVEALRVVRGWRFEPAVQTGRPVASTIRQPVRFALSQ